MFKVMHTKVKKNLQTGKEIKSTVCYSIEYIRKREETALFIRLS